MVDREKIRKEAKRIMDSFARALAKVKISESRVERVNDRRDEGGGSGGDKDFRKIMFENAPKKRNGCIEAEKGGWLE
jgi:hypothetical protein